MANKQRTIHILPIEPLEQRYTKQVLDWTVAELEDKCVFSTKNPFAYNNKGGLLYNVILPAPTYKTIENGQFLDIGGTLLFKLNQLKMVIEQLQSGVIQDGDVVFVMDIWFPGLECIRYYTDLMGFKNFKIAGIQHAGRSDYMDFIRQAGGWADDAELAFLNSCDMLFNDGGPWTVKLMRDHFGDRLSKNIQMAKGLVWNPQAIRDMANSKAAPLLSDPTEIPKPYIMFPHRTAFEKNLAELYYIADKLPKGMKIVITSSGKINVPYKHPSILYFSNISKTAYYKLLKHTELYLSLSFQDHFAFTAHEALALKTPILVKDTVAYRQFIPKDCLFDGTNELLKRLHSRDYRTPTDKESNQDSDATSLLVKNLLILLKR